MLIEKEGHIYRLKNIDGDGYQTLTFVCREAHLGLHEGTQTQEVLRAVIDHTMHCDNCRRWTRNDEIIHHLRRALLLHEIRALERKFDKGQLEPENVAVGDDGHYRLPMLHRTSDARRYATKVKKPDEGP